MNVTAAPRALEGSATRASPEKQCAYLERKQAQARPRGEAQSPQARVECERGDPETGRPASVLGLASQRDLVAGEETHVGENS